MDAVTGRACFSLAERSLTGTDRKMTPEEEQTEKREVTREVYRFLSKKCDQGTGVGDAYGSQTDETCDAETGSRTGSGTDQEVPGGRILCYERKGRTCL